MKPLSTISSIKSRCTEQCELKKNELLRSTDLSAMWGRSWRRRDPSMDGWIIWKYQTFKFLRRKPWRRTDAAMKENAKHSSNQVERTHLLKASDCASCSSAGKLSSLKWDLVQFQNYTYKLPQQKPFTPSDLGAIDLADTEKEMAPKTSGNSSYVPTACSLLSIWKGGSADSLHFHCQGKPDSPPQHCLLGQGFGKRRIPDQTCNLAMCRGPRFFWFSDTLRSSKCLCHFWLFVFGS